MAEENYQLATINAEVQDNYLISEDTFAIHPFCITCSTHIAGKDFTVDLESFCLVDDPTIVCKLEMFYSNFNTRRKKYETSNANLSFLTEVPPAYEYQISLYYVNRSKKIVHVSDLNVKNVKENDKFVIPFNDANISVSYVANNAYHYAYCIKISRRDILANLNKKPALLLPSQITDCSLLFENSALTNCTIIVEDREFRVHKEILAAKSPVFLIMFESEFKEKKENQVIIDDIETEIFHEFLRYVYTNVVNDLNVHAQKLLMVAEKYDVHKLKLICIDEMTRSLKVENAVYTLMFADRYSLKSLKDNTMGFIKNHIKFIFDTKEYEKLHKSEQAYLLSEILQVVV